MSCDASYSLHGLHGLRFNPNPNISVYPLSYPAYAGPFLAIEKCVLRPRTYVPFPHFPLRSHQFGFWLQELPKSLSVPQGTEDCGREELVVKMKARAMRDTKRRCLEYFEWIKGMELDESFP